MSDLDILHQMVKDAAKVSLVVGDYGRNQITLTESQQASSSVTVRGIPDDTIVIKADAFRSPDTVFHGSHGECKRADFVIVADNGDKRVILYVEMKATKGSAQEIIQQLTGAQCFVAYCREIGKAFWNQQNFLQGYEERFVTIGHTRIAKQKTRITNQVGVHDHPTRVLKIDSPHHLQFNHLVGGNS